MHGAAAVHKKVHLQAASRIFNPLGRSGIKLVSSLARPATTLAFREVALALSTLLKDAAHLAAPLGSCAKPAFTMASAVAIGLVAAAAYAVYKLVRY
jgi:hypothetical protein